MTFFYHAVYFNPGHHVPLECQNDRWCCAQARRRTKETAFPREIYVLAFVEENSINKQDNRKEQQERKESGGVKTKAEGETRKEEKRNTVCKLKKRQKDER